MQAPTFRRTRYMRPKFFALFFALMVMGLAVAAELYPTRSESKAVARVKAGKTEMRTLNPSRHSRWSPARMFGMPVTETIATFAADCTTPRSTFYAGETVCAQTDNVDLNWPGGRWVDWILTGTTNTIVSGSRTTTLITQNPQTFTYAATATGTYKAEITQDDGNGGDNPQTPAIFTVIDAPPIAIYNGACTMAEDTFVLGQTVCAKVTGFAGYRLAWVDAGGYIERTTDITSSSQTDTFTLPSTQTSVVNGVTVDNRGQWRVNVITSRSSVRSAAFSTVKDPAAQLANLSITKTLLTNSPAAGGPVNYEVVITNNGPDDAVNAHFVDDTFSNATFSSVNQTSGPAFTCGTGSTADCTIASFPNGSIASFTLSFTAGSAGSNLDNTASVSSDTADNNTLDNSFKAATVKIGAATTPDCQLSCPQNINANADTTENSQRGTHVSYADPTAAGTCGTVSYDHASGSFFPVGTTTVTATSTQGDGTCSFTVTVTDNGSNPPTISCPANQTANADSNCQASVTVGTATATGNNVTVIGFRSDGKPLYTCDAFGNCTRNSSDQPFSVGITTIQWIAYSHDIAGPYNATTGDEESHRTGSASCNQTITVNDVTPPNIGATDGSASADANCLAPVPDYSSTVTDNCACDSSDSTEACAGHPHVTYTQTPAAGTLVGLGPHTVHIEANDNSSNNGGAGNTSTKDITFTVVDTTAPTFTFVPPMVTAFTGASATTCDTFVSNATLGTPTATDNCTAVTFTRSPAGNTFNVGDTTVVWSARDVAGNVATANQVVRVIDNTPPTISCPASIVLEPTCPSGAIATYTTPVGQDNCPGAITTRTAGGASGTVFPIGTTTVTYSVTDASGNGPVSCSFTVTVKTPAEVVQDLISRSQALQPPLTGPQTQGLVSKLNQALTSINSGNYSSACGKLGDYVTQVQNYINNGTISAAQGQPLITSANKVRNAIGCTNNPCT